MHRCISNVSQTIYFKGLFHFPIGYVFAPYIPLLYVCVCVLCVFVTIIVAHPEATPCLVQAQTPTKCKILAVLVSLAFI